MSFSVVCAVGGHAFEIVPIPRFDVNELSVEEFDKRFLSKEPVILTGVSTCPSGISFNESKKYCWGKIGKKVRMKISPNESEWAGLKQADVDSEMQIGEFIDRMGSFSNPHFAFDVQLPSFCPAFVSKVHLPAHFATVFEAHWRERHMWSLDYRKCVDMPFYNSYLADAGFETDMHIDNGHTSFTASMCEGQKRWRIFTAQNMSAFKADFSKEAKSENKTFNESESSARGVFPKMSLHSPFDTWSTESPMNSKTGLVVFEGVLSPGETIYIPGGAPHAAITLSKSWMVASNDQTLEEVKDILEVCQQLRNHSEYSGWCEGQEGRFNKLLENYKLYKHTVSRVPMSFLEAHDCRGVDVDRVTNSHENAGQLTLVTPDNLYELLADGPLMLVKLRSGNQYWSSALRPRIPLMPARFQPRLRVGIVCDGGCIHSSMNSSKVVVENAYLSAANGRYIWQNDSLLTHEQGKSTIFFDVHWKLSLDGKTIGNEYDFGFGGTLQDPEDGEVKIWRAKMLKVSEAYPDEANGVYLWQGNQTYEHIQGNSTIYFDVVWKLNANGIKAVAYDFAWNESLDTKHDMRWRPKDGNGSCSVTFFHTSDYGNATMFNNGSSAWEEIREMNSFAPEFMIVKPRYGGLARRNESLNFTIDYFVGYNDHDLILTWAGMITGFAVSGLQFRWRLVCLTYNAICWSLSQLVIAFGYRAHTNGPFQLAPGIVIPDGASIAGAGIYVATTAVLLLFSCCCVRRWRTRRFKAKTE